MAWTLVLILCLAAFILVVYFGKTFHILQRRAFVYPSEAEIDQILPPEVIESILTNLDLNTLYSCTLVSKYWRHHAEKDHIIKQAIQKEKPMRIDTKDLWTDISKSNRFSDIRTSDIEWLTYDEKHYRPQWHARDRQYVEKNGKKFIDVNFTSLLKLRDVFSATTGTKGDELLHEYVARTRLKYSSSGGKTHSFYNPWTYDTVYVPSDTLPDHIKDNLHSYAQVEIVEQLVNFQGTSVKLSSPSNIRLLETRSFFGGVPMDGSLFALMYLLFVPCVIKDLWNASENTKYYANLVFANFGLFGTILLSSLLTHDNVALASVNQRPLAKRQLAFGTLGILILSLVCYKWTIEFGFHCALEAGCVFYGMMVVATNTETRQHGKKAIFISFCLVVSIIDWKLTVDAIRSGEIWYSLLYNLMHHGLIVLWSMLVAAGGSFLYKRQLDRTSYYLDRTYVSFLIASVLSVLYITCASPYTIRKVYL